MSDRLTAVSYFYPRPPRGGRRASVVAALDTLEFLSTPSARRATRILASDGRASCISIHALREEGDLRLCRPELDPAGISIHALREEGDAWLKVVNGSHTLFLSTPSARRATWLTLLLECAVLFLSTPSARRATQRYGDRILWQYISIHALREEGDLVMQQVSQQSFISIHALREEGDDEREQMQTMMIEFLSTPSARRATGPCNPRAVLRPISIHALREEGDPVLHSKRPVRGYISIHALREEGDLQHQHRLPTPCYFYPRPPRGGRHNAPCSVVGVRVFLSTPSARRATRTRSRKFSGRCISIHALREEGDFFRRLRRPPNRNFYPRPPRGGRHDACHCLFRAF